MLIAKGYSVTTLCYFEYDPVVVSEYWRAGSQVELIELQRNISPGRLINLLHKQFKKFNPDVVHVQYMAPGALPIIAARLAGVKRIFAVVHQPWTRQFHGIKAKILLRISAWLTTRFIVVSENAEKSWFGNSALYDPANAGITGRKHFTIHNSIDLDQIDSILRKTNTSTIIEKQGWEKALVIGAVSRLSKEKGIDLLLEAFSVLAADNEDLRLMIVGGGPDENLLKTFAIEKGIASKVLFAGNKTWEEAIALMGKMDIVVCPSRFEGFGLTAAEAMAVGKPVIASAVFGLKEVVITGETGLTFPVDDADELSQCLLTLINDVPMRKNLGRSGRERALSHFSIRTFEEKIAALYKKK